MQWIEWFMKAGAWACNARREEGGAEAGRAKSKREKKKTMEIGGNKLRIK